MKKAIQVSLGRTLFAVEEDAYLKLDAYLTSIRALFANVEGKDEIIADIEGRIAEKFMESGKSVITIDEVEAVIKTMGQVEDYREAAGEKSSERKEEKEEAAGGKKKFYRDPQGAMVAGVCTGLANYFGVEVIWVRLAFVIAALINGLGIIAYLVIWVIAPEAKTSSQRLEMEGMPVTIETLKEQAEAAIENMRRASGGRVQEVTRSAATGITRFISTLGAFIRKVIALGIILGSMAVIIAASVAAPFILANPQTDLFAVPENVLSLTMIWAIVLIGYMLIVLPCVAILLLGVSLWQRKFVLNGAGIAALTAAWVLCLMGAAGVSARVIPAVNEYVRTSPDFEQITRSFDVPANLTSIEARDGMRVTLVQGETSSMKAAGRVIALDRVLVEEREGTLVLRLDHARDICFFCELGSVEVTLTLPAAKEVRAVNGSRINMDAWVSTEPLALEALMGSRLIVTADAPLVQLTVREGSRADVLGNAGTLKVISDFGSRVNVLTTGDTASITAEQGARVDARKATYREMNASARMGARVEVGTVETLTALADIGGRITYEGTPKVQLTETDGGSVEPAYVEEERFDDEYIEE